MTPSFFPRLFLIALIGLFGAQGVHADTVPENSRAATLDQENQDYLGSLTVLDGRMMAVMALYREQQKDDAARQIDLVIAMNHDLQDTITRHGGDDTGPVLMKMQTQITGGQDLDTVAETYAEWRNALLGIRFQTPYSLGTQLRAVAVAAKTAADLYQSTTDTAPNNTTLNNKADYQAAFGIIQAAKQVIQLYIGETTTDDQRKVFENIATELNGFDVLLPAIIPPTGLRVDAAGFTAAAQRIEMLGLTLR